MAASRRHHHLPALQALFVTFLWSTSWVLIKFGLQEIPAIGFAGLRYALAFLLLGERLSPVQWIGGALLVVGMVLMTRDPGMRLAQGNEPLEWKHS